MWFQEASCCSRDKRKSLELAADKSRVGFPLWFIPQIKNVAGHVTDVALHLVMHAFPSTGSTEFPHMTPQM